MNTGDVPSSDLVESICRENLSVYRESSARLLEDVSQESQVAHDYRGRLVYELLQNADDAMAGSTTTDDRALFRLTDTELWVANTGRAFTDADVRGLCGLGASSKARSTGPKRASIGHKGMGFKSVLEITDAPEAYADTISFRLGREQALRRVAALWADRGLGAVTDVPAMRFPVAIEDPHPTWLLLRAEGYRTAFRFPFHPGISPEQKAALAHQLLSLPLTTVLFLKHLEQVTLDVETHGDQETRQWLLERHRVTEAGETPCAGLTATGLYRVDLVNEAGQGDSYWVAHNDDVQIGEHRDGLAGPAWAGVDVSEVSVAVRDATDPRIDPDHRRFHVFLPTQEPAGCSLLVNGAFTTDLSRQHVQVTDTPHDYNAHLIRQAAVVFTEVLVPHLERAVGPHQVLRVLDLRGSEPGAAGRTLSQALTSALADHPLLPSGPNRITLADTVLPSPVLGNEGADFARLLLPGSGVPGRRFPDPDFCQGDLATVCADYGATALSPVDSLTVLASSLDPTKAALQDAVDPRLRRDPVLDLCVLLWERAGAAERHALEQRARHEAVFPIGEDDGTIRRIALANQSAFYPPRSSAGPLPLQRLQFLAHAVCWGTLGRTEQRSILAREMKAWDALFDIKEFRFEEVMRAAVLPGLTRIGSPDIELREANRSIDVLAAVCRLAGKTTKPDQPLPLSRLGSDRAFFNLSRLQVPCRPDLDGVITWESAHRVYFGRDWVGDDSVETIVDAMAAAGAPLDVRFLAGPQVFADYPVTTGSEAVDTAAENRVSETDAGEVDLDDDTDEALETTAIDRWLTFFSWLGVSRGLRLVPFHDVDDGDTGWTTTKGLDLPGGWAFAGLHDVWSDYVKELVATAAADARWESTDHYLYQVHNLDRLKEITSVAQVKGNDVAQRLMEHLVRNWSLYSRHTQAQLALVGTGKWPSSRTKPPRATSDELVTVGPNLWLHRLRNHAICPTSHGPRRPDQTWRRSDELTRRLGRSGRDAGDYVPVLSPLEAVPASTLRKCLDELNVRAELTPTAFTIEDARHLCRQVARVHVAGVTDHVLRTEVRPIYRQMFELLVGSITSEPTPLADAPLAARTADGVAFLPARDVVYASTSGSRERSGIQGRVPLFVLEAEPGAQRPLRELFGAPFLETALDWRAVPGDPALEEEHLAEFRIGLNALIPPLLARLAADRAHRAMEDAATLQAFTKSIEPVQSLKVACRFRGEDLGAVPQRTYFVRRSADGSLQCFAIWQGNAWPPIAEDAQTLALALAETLEVNTVETFLSFINASPAQRHQLLELAGAAELLAEVEQGLADHSGRRSAEEPPPGPDPIADVDATDGESTEAEYSHSASAPAPTAPAATRVPLHRFEDLLIDGDVIHIEGSSTPGVPTAAANTIGGATTGPTQVGVGDPTPRAAAGTDLDALDRLGMRITFAFERRRFTGRTVAVLPGDPVDAADVLIVDVSSPKMIDAAMRQSATVEAVFKRLADENLSSLYPGFDILTIRDGQIDRMIELKSSGIDSQIQAMSWNEWKTAQGSLQEHYWLYLVGNLRADLRDAAPFVRAVRDPFSTLASASHEDTIRKRTVQLRVREFAAADQLTLQVRSG